jgi:hypothetical protein
MGRKEQEPCLMLVRGGLVRASGGSKFIDFAYLPVVYSMPYSHREVV